jgi:DNA polymerase-3 subunit epsilon
MAKELQKFAVVDIETTGGRAARDKITEIGIVLHDGQQILDTFETLLNPQTYIPAGISQLTGITQEMVKDAPLFHEVAREIVERTAGAVFVAHNARFDYSFLRAEFSRLGYTYSRKQLCTVRLSRKAFPGLPSYSLGNLIRHFGIQVDARHRALADALATADLLERILAQERSQEQMWLMVNLGIKETRLPQGISLDQIHDLPEACGVYYFHGSGGEVVYVGKSINIKKRIADHFADHTHKGKSIREQVRDISYELTGSELVALLLESDEIKRLKPPINRAQRRTRFPHAIHSWVNEAGYRCFGVVANNATNRKQYDIMSEYPSLSRAKGRLDAMVRKFELCNKYCDLHKGRGACFQFHLKQCHGACCGQEDAANYNSRAEEAYEKLKSVFDDDFLLLDVGRNPTEQAVVLVREGQFAGFGYVSTEEAQDRESLLGAVKSYPSYPDTARIIQRFLNDHPKARVIAL